MCLIALPVLALPGILYQSETLLIASIVGFQVIHALWLGTKCGLFSKNLLGWMDKELLLSMLMIACMTCTAILVDLLLKPFFKSQILLHGLFACCWIAVIVVSAQKILINKESTESET